MVMKTTIITIVMVVVFIMEMFGGDCKSDVDDNSKYELRIEDASIDDEDGEDGCVNYNHEDAYDEDDDDPTVDGKATTMTNEMNRATILLTATATILILPILG